TPPRGIGKTTMEVVERLALETGLSLWGAVGESVTRNLLPARALQALKSFRDLVEDARGMAAGTFAEKLSESAGDDGRGRPSLQNQDDNDVEARASLRQSQGGPSPVQRSEAPQEEDETEFDPSAFDFGGHHEIRAESSAQADSAEEFNPAELADEDVEPNLDDVPADAPVEGFRTPGAPANTAEILKFLIDRTGYIKLLEEEDSPEAFSRVENIRELVNAAMDSKDRGETLDQ